MSVNRFASHFMLSPDGELLRWPVITVNDEGVIESVEHFENGFQERPFTRFFAGILCPAFVDIFAEVTTDEIERHKSVKNRHFRDGTILLGVKADDNPVSKANDGLPVVMEKKQDHAISPLSSGLSGQGTLLERMKTHSSDVSMTKMLLEVTMIAARSTGFLSLGRLEKGASPGILLLQNIDLVSKRWTPSSSVRWLSIPAVIGA
ncbi:hypothetical protein [Marinilabilia salmonicolor]|jgi:hypothetical protein|uniref:Uncharacterized protein n=1 Tax=Marinilabilia salmonicolor TaxID=989 RepID=A0A368UMH7_9BACT|nr:hypothetical protein [Marinilabilia salmonicolor]RCW30017.1 hypothetical protein DFO77_12429 [Marinilabilia salmonicolor]